MHFKKHYTIEEARALLPKVREWLVCLEHTHRELELVEKRLEILQDRGDIGGETVNRWAKAVADFRAALFQFESREIQVKDLQRGLVDFPALREDKEIFLCWEKDEQDIEHWHDLDSGYAGREPL